MKADILFFSGGSYVFGKERAMLRIMSGLKERGWKIHCVTNGFNDGVWGQMLEGSNIDYTPVRLGKFTKSLKPIHIKWTIHALLFLPFALYKIHRLLVNDPKWLLFDSHITASIVLKFFRPKGIPIIRHGELPGKSAFFFKILKTQLERVQIYHIGNTHFVCDQLKKLGIPARNISCIYNGFSIPTITDETKRLKVPDSPMVIGCIGQLGPWKGQEDLIRALFILKKQGISFLCRIAGKGDDTFLNYLKDLIFELGLTGQIEICGYIDKPEHFYRDIHVNVVPSRFEEPFGNVAAESGLYSIPCIVSNKGGLPEVIIDGKTGFIVPAEDPDAIASKLTWFAFNHKERKEMGENAYYWIRENFSQEKMIDNYETLLSTF